MKDQTEKPNLLHHVADSVRHLGFYSALATALLTALTFIIAINAPPITGPFCRGDCIPYPYADTFARFPGDFYWMYPAILMMLAFVVLLVCLHHAAAPEKKIFSHLGLVFGLMSGAILLVDYFLQVSVIPPSLRSGETEGVALLTQFNPHGLFIALEEIGYLLMSLALFSIIPIFAGRGAIRRTIRWFLGSGFVLNLLALAIIVWVFGLGREYIFEVVIISINFLILITVGILIAILFRRRMV